jgi:hypothetical protein
VKRPGFRRLLFTFSAALCAFALSGNFSIQPVGVAAQSVPRPNVAVSIYDTPVGDQPPSKAALGSFSPGNPTLNRTRSWIYRPTASESP